MERNVITTLGTVEKIWTYPVKSLHYVEHDVIAVEAQKHALEAPASAGIGGDELEFRFVTRPAGEIGDPRQRPVDSRRGHFQNIFAFQWILGVEEFGKGARQLGAILHIHLSVGAFGHDLQRLVLGAHQPEAHEPVARRFHLRGDNRLQLRHGRENGRIPLPVVGFSPTIQSIKNSSRRGGPFRLPPNLIADVREWTAIYAD